MAHETPLYLLQPLDAVVTVPLVSCGSMPLSVRVHSYDETKWRTTGAFGQAELFVGDVRVAVLPLNVKELPLEKMHIVLGPLDSDKQPIEGEKYELDLGDLLLEISPATAARLQAGGTLVYDPAWDVDFPSEDDFEDWVDRHGHAAPPTDEIP